MRSYVITEKNIGNIYDKVNRFFKDAKVKAWHNFDCGFNGKIEPFTTYPDNKSKGYRYYQDISTKFVKSKSCSWFVVILNINERFHMDYGDRISISSNRLIVRRNFKFCGIKYVYEIYEKKIKKK